MQLTGRDGPAGVREPVEQLGGAARLLEEGGHGRTDAERPQHLLVTEAGGVRRVVQADQERIAALRAQPRGPAAVQDRMAAQPPGRVRADGLRRAVRQQHPQRLGQGVPQRRAREHREGLGPVVVVDQVEVPHGDDLGGDGRHGRVRQPVEHVLAPHVDGVQEPGVVGLGEVTLTGVEFIGVEDDVGGPYEGERGEHPAGGERLLTPALGRLGVHEGQLVLAHDLGEGAAGQDEFTGRGRFAVLVGQGEGREPRLVARREVRVAHQGEHDLRELLRVQGLLVPRVVVEGRGHRGAHLRRRQDRAGRGGQGAQLLQERVDGVGVGDLQAEAGQRRLVALRTGGGQQHLPGPDRRTRSPGAGGPGGATGQRHGQPREALRVDPGEGVVQPPPPAGLPLQPGQAVDRLGQRDPGDPEGAQLGPAFEARGQQAGQHLGEYAYGVGARSLDDLGVPRAQRLGQLVVVIVRAAGQGGRQEGGAGQPLQDALAQGAVQLAAAERARHQGDDALPHGPPVGEEFGVRVRRALHEEVGEGPGGGVPPCGVQRERGDEQRRYAQRLVARRRRVHDRRGAGALRGAVGARGDGPGDGPVRAQPLLDGAVLQEGGVQRSLAADGAPAGRAVAAVLDDGVRGLGAAAQGAYGAVRGLDADLLKTRQGEEQGVVHGVEQPGDEVLRGGVAQGQDDDGVVSLGGGALGGHRQAQERYVAVPAADLVAESRAEACGPRGQFAGLGQGPADAAGAPDDGGFVADGEHGGEAHAEAADAVPLLGLALLLPLGGGAEGGEGLDAGGVQRGAAVGRGEDAVAERQGEPAGDTGAGRGVGGVLGQLDDEAVAVAAEGEVLLGVGVLAEAGGGRGPRVEDSAAEACGAEGVRPLGRQATRSCSRSSLFPRVPWRGGHVPALRPNATALFGGGRAGGWGRRREAAAR
ncbi:hypothetical protein SALBM135S_04823 [Streptomyces alboniger]